MFISYTLCTWRSVQLNIKSLAHIFFKYLEYVPPLSCIKSDTSIISFHQSDLLWDTENNKTISFHFKTSSINLFFWKCPFRWEPGQPNLPKISSTPHLSNHNLQQIWLVIHEPKHVFPSPKQSFKRKQCIYHLSCSKYSQVTNSGQGNMSEHAMSYMKI